MGSATKFISALKDRCWKDGGADMMTDTIAGMTWEVADSVEQVLPIVSSFVGGFIPVKWWPIES